MNKKAANKNACANTECYVVRIYRRDHQNPETIIGIVETIGTGRKDTFKSPSELFDILTQTADDTLPYRDASLGNNAGR